MPEIPLLHAVAGGVLMGLGLGLLMLFRGQIGGAGGAFSSLLRGDGGPGQWKLIYVLGIVAGGAAVLAILPANFEASRYDRSLPLLLASGLLMGFGARMCNGCTSGHGLCGIARFSRRSMVATGAFFGIALVSTFTLRHLLGVF